MNRKETLAQWERLVHKWAKILHVDGWEIDVAWMEENKEDWAMCWADSTNRIATIGLTLSYMSKKKSNETNTPPLERLAIHEVLHIVFRHAEDYLGEYLIGGLVADGNKLEARKLVETHEERTIEELTDTFYKAAKSGTIALGLPGGAEDADVQLKGVSGTDG